MKVQRVVFSLGNAAVISIAVIPSLLTLFNWKLRLSYAKLRAQDKILKVEFVEFLKSCVNEVMHGLMLGNAKLNENTLSYVVLFMKSQGCDEGNIHFHFYVNVMYIRNQNLKKWATLENSVTNCSTSNNKRHAH